MNSNKVTAEFLNYLKNTPEIPSKSKGKRKDQQSSPPKIQQLNFDSIATYYVVNNG